MAARRDGDGDEMREARDALLDLRRAPVPAVAVEEHEPERSGWHMMGPVMLSDEEIGRMEGRGQDGLYMRRSARRPYLAQSTRTRASPRTNAPLNAYPLRSLFRYGDKDVLAMGDDAVVDRIAKAHRAKLRRWLAGATVATPSGPGTTTDLANGSGQYPVRLTFRLRDGTTRRYAWSTVRDSLPSSPP